jgi:hypothetical protein
MLASDARHDFSPLDGVREKSQTQFGSGLRLTPRFELSPALPVSAGSGALSVSYELGWWLDRDHYGLTVSKVDLNGESHADSVLPESPVTAGLSHFTPKSFFSLRLIQTEAFLRSQALFGFCGSTRNGRVVRGSTLGDHIANSSSLLVRGLTLPLSHIQFPRIIKTTEHRMDGNKKISRCHGCKSPSNQRIPYLDGIKVNRSEFEDGAYFFGKTFRHVTRRWLKFKVLVARCSPKAFDQAQQGFSTLLQLPQLCLGSQHRVFKFVAHKDEIYTMRLTDVKTIST